MGNKQINIKSSTIEKGLELAKDFVGKLIGPTIEELGLLIADNVKYFRFKNQVRILNKARKYVESRNIKTRQRRDHKMVRGQLVCTNWLMVSIFKSSEMSFSWIGTLKKNVLIQTFVPCVSQNSSQLHLTLCIETNTPGLFQ